MDAFEHVSQRIDDIYKVRKCSQVHHLLVFVTLPNFKVWKVTINVMRFLRNSGCFTLEIVST